MKDSSPRRSAATFSAYCQSDPTPHVQGDARTLPSMLRVALWLSVLSCAQALAQGAGSTASSDTQSTGLAEVVVTGSRIPVPANITATSPTVALSTQEIMLEGHADTSDLINQLPQNIIQSNADFGNTTNPLTNAGGTTTADLRGLGPQRTLVLVDGKRLYIGDPDPVNPNPAADLDQIPSALVERVDVVTGGASAVYGSDAVGGVINFIMKKNFEGIEIDGQYGLYQHDNSDSGIRAVQAAQQSAIGPSAPPFVGPSGNIHDGNKRDLSILMGTNMEGGDGNVTGYFVYHHQDPVRAADRDFSNCQLRTNSALTGFDCVGSPNSNYFTPQSTGITYSVVGNQFQPYPQVGSSPPAEFNSNPYLYEQRQDQRYSAGLNAHVDVNDHVKPYLTATFMDDRGTEVVGPSAAFMSSYPFTPDNYYRVNCSNPLLSTQERGIMCTQAQIDADTLAPGADPANQAIIDIGRRNIEGGGRIEYNDHTNYRVAVGATGDVIPGFTYDAYAQYYYVSLFNSNSNYLNYANIGQALIATGTAANPVCTNTVGGCVPWNIFTQGGVTAAQLAYLQSPGTGYGSDSETITHVDFTGELGQYGLTSPWAHEGVGVNFGAEHRADTYDYAPDAVQAAAELAGSGAFPALSAAESVNEGFIEIRTPLMQDHSGVKDLDLDIGYRYSSYSLAGSTNTYKFEVQYAPLPDFRLRYSYDRAVRAPNLFELFSPQSYGQNAGQGTDPCAGPTPSASLTACENTGVTQTEYNSGSIIACPAQQCGEVVGGNPKLLPEEADTYSIGITLTPTFLPQFSGSIDYWHIAQFNLIGTIPANVILDQCLATGASIWCSQINRNPVTGALTGATVAGGGYVYQTDINAGTGLTSGIDAQFNYRWPLGTLGTVSAAFNGSYLEHSISTPYPGSGSYDCAGLFGSSCNSGSVNPRWRHTLRASWETPWSKLLLSADWRFIGATHFDNNSNNPLLRFAEKPAGYDFINARIPTYSYLDLSAVWPVWRQLELHAGINNLFDKEPPIVPTDVTGTGSANTYQTYDTLGRELFVGFTARL